MKKIVIASTNSGKIQEIIDIIHEMGLNELELLSLREYTIPEPDEPYDDFMKNAVHKAKYYGNIIKLPTLSDDSGLCIEALNGFPGVKSKHFILECGGVTQVFKQLEKMLSGVTNPRAYFQTALVLFYPEDNRLITHEYQHHGTLSFPSRGGEGLAFDPIFIPEGFNQTVAELGLTVKNQISHRAQALKGLMQKWNMNLK